MRLSVVIPVYNEETRIQNSLTQVLDYLKANSTFDHCEVIVVNDGSSDNTVSIVRRFMESNHFIKLIDYNHNRGKGFAIKKGIFFAKGEYILFMDADLSTPFEEVNQLISYLDKGYDLSIGSRGLKNSQIIIHQPKIRETMGKIFNLLIRLLLIKNIKDTQCGFKCFKKEVAKEIFSQTKINGFSFDVEALYIAKKKGFKIKEVPIRWYNSSESKVKIFKDPIKMIFDIFRIRFINKYYL